MTEEEIASLKPGDVIAYRFSALSSIEPYYYTVLNIGDRYIRTCVREDTDEEWRNDFERLHLLYESFQLEDQDPL